MAPLLIKGLTVDTWSLAKPLIVMVLAVPLAAIVAEVAARLFARQVPTLVP